jgi:hypothetical protein
LGQPIDNGSGYIEYEWRETHPERKAVYDFAHVWVGDLYYVNCSERFQFLGADLPLITKSKYEI